MLITDVNELKTNNILLTVRHHKLHQSSASWDSTASMPPRSPSGKFLPAGLPLLTEEPSRTHVSPPV
jgi:hypothetical protein